MTLPNPVNQFYRLNYVSGPRGTGTYSYGSRWGTGFDSQNCTAAMGAMLLNAHVGGSHTPPEIRSHQYDQTGGIGWDDVNVAWQKLAGKQLILPPSADWADVLVWLKEGRIVGIQGDNDQMGAWQCQAGGFTHAYALAGYRTSDGRILEYDPLCTKARWIPQYAMRLAAEKLALNERGSKSRLFVGLTRVINPPVAWASDMASDIKAAYTASAVASKLRSLGITNYGTAINYIDLEAGLQKRGIDYGSSVQLIDVRALMKAGTGA